MDCYPDTTICPIHEIKLPVLKTDKRDARSTQYPRCTLRKVYLYCPMCRDENERGLDTNWKYVPDTPIPTRGKSPFSMDVVTIVGKMRFLECIKTERIQEILLARHGVYASVGSLSAMCMEFLVRLKCLHELRSNILLEDIQARGGYILGIDGTGDGASERILVEMDMHRNWVLAAVRIPSESKDCVEPRIKSLTDKFGVPLASLSDMAKGMMHPLENILSGVPQYVCHFHFIDDVGSDLMKCDYMRLRQLIINSKLHTKLTGLRKSLYYHAEASEIDMPNLARELRAGGVPQELTMASFIMVEVYDTLSWILRYHEDNNALRFPFSLPYLNFFKRCREGLKTITKVRKIAAKGMISTKYLRDMETMLRNGLEAIDKNMVAISSIAASLEKSYQLFEELREALHIPKNKGDIPRDMLILHANQKNSEMKAALIAFRETLRTKAKDGKHPKEDIVVTHLDKYWKYITPESITVEINGQDNLIEMPRTTSVNETCFGMVKTDLRKRLGKKSVGRELNHYGDYLCYIQNLKDESYVSLVCGSFDDLPKAFDQIPLEMVKEELHSLRKRKAGYDITNVSTRVEKIRIEDIQKGIDAMNFSLEASMFGRNLQPMRVPGI